MAYHTHFLTCWLLAFGEFIESFIVMESVSEVFQTSHIWDLLGTVSLVFVPTWDE